MAILISNNYHEYFDIQHGDISSIYIEEIIGKNNCRIKETNGNKIYDGFVLVEKSQVKTLCKVSFYKSNTNNKYLPRLEFRKVDNSDNVKIAKGKDVIIDFNSGDNVRNFWKMVNFLNGFKDLVDLGDFHKKYQALSFEGYFFEFKSKDKANKIKDIMSLVEQTTLSSEDIKAILFSQRKKTVFGFYCFLKNCLVQEKEPFSYYRNTREIKEQGEEVIWHHFLKENNWIIGLNVKLEFIRDLISEQKIGIENSDGAGSPKVDFLGVSYFISLIELKTSNTKIFKLNKTSNSRANTWDFSNEFIEAYSQILAQKSDFYSNKRIINEKGEVLDLERNRVLDPKAILIIGNRNIEFPHARKREENIKSDSFERFRRGNKNVEIITFDELFERAYHIVYTKLLPLDWYNIEEKTFIKEYLNYL